MSSKLGPLYYGKENEVALRIYNQKNLSESVQSTIDSEVRDLITEAQTRCQKILHDNAAKVKVMAELLLAHETIYLEDINLVMEGKSAAAITKTMDERREKEIKMANDDRINDMLNQVEPLLKRSLEIAQLHLAENLVTEEHMQKLQRNCELAREYIRHTGKIPPIPTIDLESLDNYPTLVAYEVTTETKQQTAEPVKKTTPKKPTATKKPTAKKPTKETKDGNGSDKKTALHPQVPAHE